MATAADEAEYLDRPVPKGWIEVGYRIPEEGETYMSYPSGNSLRGFPTKALRGKRRIIVRAGENPPLVLDETPDGPPAPTFRWNGYGWYEP